MSRDILAISGNLEKIPYSWAEQQGWTRSRGPLGSKEAKRPLIDPDKAHMAGPLASVKDSENPIGFLTSLQSPIVIIDVDAPKDLKEQVKALRQAGLTQEADTLIKQRLIDPLPAPIRSYLSSTYVEWSQSMVGLHIVLSTDKTAWTNPKAYYKAEWLGQLSVHSNYMVTTGNVYHQSDILVVSPEELDALFGISKRITRDTPMGVPTLTEMEQALAVLPLDQSPRIKEVYSNITGEAYEHYSFWLKVGMAIHDYAVRTNSLSTGLELFLKWSATDPTDFDGDESVERKWNSFTHSEDGITYNTVLKLAAAFQFNYPRRLRSREGTLLINPDTSEYVNFKYLMDKYNLTLYACGTELYLQGDESIIKKYFMLQGVHNMFGYYGPFDATLLQAATWVLCQDSHWRKLNSTISFVNRWIAEPKQEVDVFNKWLDTPDLPPEYRYPRFFGGTRHDVPNTFEYVASCIEWAEDQDVQLCKRMLYRTFMQLIKLHDPTSLTFEDNGGMFALIGPENTYKTTFFKLLLPVPLEFLRKDINQELTGEKNKRDFIRYLSTSAIVLVDEFEGFMDNKKSGSFFKSIISGNVTSFTDIYQTKELALKRKAILVGTSNELRQIISDNGSRRLWFARIKMVHTERLLNVDLHAFYNNMRDEFRALVAQGKAPWLMEFTETLSITQQNKAIKAQSSVDIALRDLFDYTTDYNVHAPNFNWERFLQYDGKLTRKALLDNPRLMKTSQVAQFLSAHDIRVPFAELERALERFCMDFIGQTKDVEVQTNTHAKVVVKRGQLCCNLRPNGTYNHKFWIMPIPEDFDETK